VADERLVPVRTRRVARGRRRDDER